jgi:AraC-like DNA-binding protein
MDNVELKPFVFHAKNDPTLCERFKTVLNIWRAQKPDHKERAISEFYHIIATMKRHYFTDYMPKEKYSVLKPAIEYIHANYHKESVKVEDLAKLCRITPEYFRSIFKANFGTSPVKYINAIKIARAKELLDSNMYSVTEAATLSGFNDISHFSREFQRSCGQNPSQYAKAPR